MFRNRQRGRASAAVAATLACMLSGLFWMFGVVGTAHATEFDMNQLPVTTPNLCAACHVSDDPDGGDTTLNAFGLDYRENGRIWDSDLAQLDSDGDGCLNGVEVGDSDGDGIADGNVTEQAGNPGVRDDCGSGSIVDERTWDALKAMFDR